jgi:hypothetical protein
MSRPSRLAADHHPVAVTFDLPGLPQSLTEVESELGARAARDRNGCYGYFPALEGAPGIDSNLPACLSFGTRWPSITHRGTEYLFNFIRLSLMQQSSEPAFHLDSDAATALGGVVATLRQRRVARLLLNLSSRSGRTLHYLDVDPYSVELISEESYVRAAEPSGLVEHEFVMVIPPRRGSRVSGLAFTSNLVLHSGVDDAHGHFVAAYGMDAKDSAASSGHSAQNAFRTPSRSVRWAAGGRM